MTNITENPDMKQIILDDNDHLSNCIKYFGVNYIEKDIDKEYNNGYINYCSKFKLKEKKNTVLKRLGSGWFTLNYKGLIIFIFIDNIGKPVGLEQETKIHTIVKIFIDKNESDKLDTFFDEASDYYVDMILDKKKESNKTTIYIWDDYWETIEKRAARSLDTIYLAGLENKVHDNIKNFLLPETKKLYTSLGIPYKYNILFHGYPGTGKSSLIYALASELNMDIALLHFVRDMNDVDFMRALRRIPSNTILVLEDIDVLFEARKKNDENKTGISFSGLLNSLDGISHIDDQIVFMTTNCKMVLDKALTRPGRIDLDIEFKYSTKKQVQIMFNKFLPKQKSRFNDFYKEIKRLNLTTAILQQYFFGNIKCDNILDTIDELKEICANNVYDYKKDTLYT
jgi:SpoVK/Ycf46/Vps4 family AAA+-type ATPase